MNDMIKPIAIILVVITLTLAVAFLYDNSTTINRRINEEKLMRTLIDGKNTISRIDDDTVLVTIENKTLRFSSVVNGRSSSYLKIEER